MSTLCTVEYCSCHTINLSNDNYKDNLVVRSIGVFNVKINANYCSALMLVQIGVYSWENTQIMVSLIRRFVSSNCSLSGLIMEYCCECFEIPCRREWLGAVLQGICTAFVLKFLYEILFISKLTYADNLLSISFSSIRSADIFPLLINRLFSLCSFSASLEPFHCRACIL